MHEKLPIQTIVANAGEAIRPYVKLTPWDCIDAKCTTTHIEIDGTVAGAIDFLLAVSDAIADAKNGRVKIRYPVLQSPLDG